MPPRYQVFVYLDKNGGLIKRRNDNSAEIRRRIFGSVFGVKKCNFQIKEFIT